MDLSKLASSVTLGEEEANGRPHGEGEGEGDGEDEGVCTWIERTFFNGGGGDDVLYAVDRSYDASSFSSSVTVAAENKQNSNETK